MKVPNHWIPDRIRAAMTALGRGGSFSRVFSLASGTVGAQLVLVISTPIFTRAYSTADFAEAALFTAALGSLAPAACGRYDLAIMTEAANRAYRELFALACWVSVGLAVALQLVLLAIPSPIANLIGLEPSRPTLWLLPLAFCLSGFQSALIGLSLREGRFGDTAIARTVGALMLVPITLVLVVSNTTNGLVLGSIAATGTSVLYLLFVNRTVVASLRFRWNRARNAVARRYRNFPALSAPASIVDNLTGSLPLFFLSKYQTPTDVAFLFMVYRLTLGPLGIISASVAQVLLRRVSEMRETGEDVRRLLGLIIGVLMLTGLGFGLVAGAAGPWAFAVFLGEKWRGSGDVMLVLLPAIVLKFVATSVSSMLIAARRTDLEATWKVIAFVATLSVLYLYAPTSTFKEMLVVMVTNDLALYGLYLAFIWASARRAPQRVTSSRVKP